MMGGLADWKVQTFLKSQDRLSFFIKFLSHNEKILSLQSLFQHFYSNLFKKQESI